MSIQFLMIIFVTYQRSCLYHHHNSVAAAWSASTISQFQRFYPPPPPESLYCINGDGEPRYDGEILCLSLCFTSFFWLTLEIFRPTAHNILHSNIQPPIGGSSLPHFSMSLLEREHMKKHRIYFTKHSKREHAKINSTLCCIGAHLFESARLLRLSVQHRCENDPYHMANIKKMSAGLKITTHDLDIYRTLSRLEQFG
jgi:hypothetical protein